MLYYEGHGITSTAKAIIIVTTILGVLAIFAVALRVYARIYSKLYLCADDWTIILALVQSPDPSPFTLSFMLLISSVFT